MASKKTVNILLVISIVFLFGSALYYFGYLQSIETKIERIGEWTKEKMKSEQSQSNSEQMTSTTNKNHLITIRLEATVVSDDRVGNIKCNFGDGNYLLLGGMVLAEMGVGELFSSGNITVPSGKTWIYKDAKVIKEAPSSYKSDAIITKKYGNYINLLGRSFTGITLNEGDVFRVGCSEMDYDNSARKVPVGSIVGVDFTFIEISY